MSVRRTVGPVVAVAIIVGFAVGGVAGAQEASPSGKTRSFVEGSTAKLKWVNPFSAISTADYEVLGLNYDLLLNFGKDDLSAAPGLADRWSKSDDGLTWTFHMRPGVTWQDGEPLTAQDVAFTYRFIVENKIGTLSSYFPFSNADSFSAPSDDTFIWTTSQPTVAPEYPTWVYILPEHLWSQFNAKEAQKYNEFPVIGSGPFQLTRWEKGQSWALTANKDYWGGAPSIDEYVIKYYDNAEAMTNALKTGEIDYLSSPGADLFDSLKNVEGITTHVGVPAGFVNVIFNTRAEFEGPHPGPVGTGHPALLDERVRTAIAMSIDKQAIVDRVLRGYGEVGTSIVPPRSAYWHWSPSADEEIPFDIEGANQILDDAGYMDTDGDGVREMPGGGRPLEMRLDIENEDNSRIKAARYVVGYLRQIGISAKAEAKTYNATLAFWYDNDFDIYMWGWGPDPDPGFILSTFTAGQCQYWSDTCWSNDEYDQLYQEQRGATDLQDRQAIVFQMQQIVYEQNPEVVLYYDDVLEAYRSDRWTGFQLSPAENGYLLNQYSPYSVVTLKPVSATAGAPTSTGISAGVWIAIIAGIVVIVLAVVLMQRRRPDEDRA